MSWLKGLTVRLRAVVRPRLVGRELDEEIGLHLALETEKNVRLGMTPEAARRREARP